MTISTKNNQGSMILPTEQNKIPVAHAGGDCELPDKKTQKLSEHQENIGK